MPALRIAVSALLGVVVVTRLLDGDLDELRPDWTPAAVLWLAAAAVAMLSAFAVAALRWHAVCGALELGPSRTRLLRHQFAGQFVSTVLPSSIGGDALRSSRLAGETRNWPDSVTSVLLDRTTGWVILPCVSLVALAVDRSLATSTGGRLTMIVAVVVLCVFVAVIWAASHPMAVARLHGEGWQRFLTSIHDGLRAVLTHRAALRRMGLFGLGNALLMCTSAYLAARGLGIELSLVAAFAFIPVVLIVQVLPVSLGGLGVRESALAVLLDSVGVPAGQAVALGLTMYLLTMLSGLFGAPALAMGGGRPDRHPREERADASPTA